MCINHILVLFIATQVELANKIINNQTFFLTCLISSTWLLLSFCLITLGEKCLKQVQKSMNKGKTPFLTHVLVSNFNNERFWFGNILSWTPKVCKPSEGWCHEFTINHWQMAWDHNRLWFFNHPCLSAFCSNVLTSFIARYLQSVS